MLTALPLIYCPADMKKPPACWPARSRIETVSGVGPDAVSTTHPDGSVTVTGGGGGCYGGAFVPGATGWKKTRGGWWIQLLNHRPQDLIRVQRHPRVRQWATIQGVRPDHQWQVPVLLDRSGGVLTSALDGVWDGDRWSGGELEPLQQELLALIQGVDQGNPVDLAAEVRRIARIGLGIGHHVDDDLLAVSGWLGESMHLAVVACMAGEAQPPC